MKRATLVIVTLVLVLFTAGQASAGTIDLFTSG